MSEKIKKKNGCLISLLVVALIFLFIIVVAIVSVVSNDDLEPVTSSDTSVSQVVEEKSIFKDSNIDVKYLNVSEYSGVEGAVYLSLKITNLSSQNIILSLDHVSVNDVTTQSGTAIPIELEPNKTTKTPFIIFTKNTDIKSVNEIEKLDFAIRVSDSNYREIETTETLTVSIKWFKLKAPVFSRCLQIYWHLKVKTL